MLISSSASSSDRRENAIVKVSVSRYATLRLRDASLRATTDSAAESATTKSAISWRSERCRRHRELRIEGMTH
jgi:hypothetical protein